MDELSTYMSEHYKAQTINAVEHAIRYQFPNIKGLNVSNDADGEQVSISFFEGEYTEKEVTHFLAQFRKNK